MVNLVNTKSKLNALVRKMSSLSGIVIGIIVFVIIVILVGTGIFIHHRNSERAIKPVFFDTPHKAHDSETISAGRIIPVGDVYTFTYHMFIYIKDWKYRYGFEKDIMTKGYGASVCPSLHLSPKINDVVIRINTTRGVQTMYIRNVNVRKWCHIGVCVHEQEVDLYLDGRLQSTVVLKNVCQVNSDDLYINKNGGFSGLVYKLSYSPFGVTPGEMSNLASIKPPVRASYFSKD
jgi:hypothetical protein